MAFGWRLHRHHRGLQFLIDTTNTGGYFYLAKTGYLDVATSGYFFMAHGHVRQQPVPGVLPYLPVDIVKNYGADHQTDFVRVVSTFLDYVDGSHPFSFTDTLADFLDRADWAVNAVGARKSILGALFRLGYSHNRFYVGNVFDDVVKRSISDENLNSMIADVLNEHPTELEFVQSDLKTLSLPKPVRDVMDADNDPFDDEVQF